MLTLVLVLALTGLTSARPEGFFLPSGTPSLEGRGNLVPHATAILIPASATVPLTASKRVAVTEHQKEKAHADDTQSAQKDLVNVAEGAQPVVPSEQRSLTPSNTVLIPDIQPLAPRQLVLSKAFPTLYRLSKDTVDSGENASKTRVVRQVFGSPVWDQKVIDWGAKNCSPLPIIGGAVAGASGGPVGVALGVIGAGIGACNFQN